LDEAAIDTVCFLLIFVHQLPSGPGPHSRGF